MRDFLEILQRFEIYDEKYHNKTNNEYTLNGNLVEFISLDQPQKIRGRKRNLLFINEANELYFEDWQQLVMRTTGKVIIDYNPSDAFHWIYDKVIPRDDCEFFKTTYKDNPFLEAEIINEIERLQNTDDDYWRIYGLGERGLSRATIFQFSIVDQMPEAAKFLSYGLDFGFTNDPTSLVKVFQEGENLYIHELLYHTNLTNDDISDKLQALEVDRYNVIFADSAEPKSIEELYRKRWNIKPTAKGADSVMAGIDMLKRYKIHVTKTSLNTIKEFQNYKWQEDKNGNLLNKPIDNFNHAIDATRYAVWNKLSKPNYGSYAVR
jgi:phage terminase large subunit